MVLHFVNRTNAGQEFECSHAFEDVAQFGAILFRHCLGELLLKLTIVRGFVTCECGATWDAELDPKTVLKGPVDAIEAAIVKEAEAEATRTVVMISRHKQCAHNYAHRN